MDFDDGYGEPADEFDYSDADFTKPVLDGPTTASTSSSASRGHRGPPDTEPRSPQRLWTISDSKMKRIA